MTHTGMLELALYMGLNLDASQFFPVWKIFLAFWDPQAPHNSAGLTRNPNKQVKSADELVKVTLKDEGKCLWGANEQYFAALMSEFSISTNPLILFNLIVSQTKRCLLLGRKVMTNLDSILKNRDIILPTKICLVKAMVFPVIMYGCESWTIKKAESWRTDVFELWCWRRLLRVPWTARRPNQSILKEISPGYSLERLMLKLKLNLQHFGHLMQRTDSFEKILMLRNTEGRKRGDDRGWDGWMASLTQQTWVWVNSGHWWCTGKPGMLQSLGSQRVRHNWATELTDSLSEC